MYRVYVRLDEGEFVFVANRENPDQAARLAKELSSYWPHQYVVQDSQGDVVDCKTDTNGQPKRPSQVP